MISIQPQTFGFWQFWSEPLSDADVGRQIKVQLRSGGDAFGVIVERKPKVLVQLDDGRLVSLHGDCDLYQLGGLASAQARAA